MDILKHKTLKSLYEVSLFVEGLASNEETTEVSIKLSELSSEVEKLVDDLNTAVKYLREAKKQFAPHY